MKNDKTNKKPRKVKNYLSSLCKWAKNNIKKIIPFLGCLFLLLGMCLSSCRGSDVANATQIQNEEYFVVLPSAGGTHTSGQNYLIRPFYLSGNSDNFLLFFENSPNVGELRTYIFTDNGGGFYTVSNIMVGGISYNGSPVYLNSSETSVVDLWVDEDYMMSTPSRTIHNCMTNYVNCRVDVYEGIISYSLQKNGTDIMTISVTNTNITSTTTYTIFLNWSSSYYTGYELGYDEGYDVGYDVGYYRGLDTELGTPFDVFSSFISDLFNIPLFGNVTIATVLYIAFGILSISIILKVIGR